MGLRKTLLSTSSDVERNQRNYAKLTMRLFTAALSVACPAVSISNRVFSCKTRVDGMIEEATMARSLLLYDSTFRKANFHAACCTTINVCDHRTPSLPGRRNVFNNFLRALQIHFLINRASSMMPTVIHVARVRVRDT